MTQAEFRRETLRVLPLLQLRHRMLAALENGTYGVVGVRSKKARVQARVDTPIVEAMLRNELIERAPGRADSFLLSSVGTAFLARAKATADPFAAQHRVLVPRGKQTRVGRAPDVNAAESPLTWLRTRKGAGGGSFLSDAEYLAGERLREDFTLALMTPKSATSWPLERVDYSRRADFSPIYESERVNAARKRFWKALDAVGPELAPTLVGVCCHLQGLETTEARLDLPKRSCKAMLKAGLGCLARHYGLVRDRAERSIIRARSFGILPSEKD